MIECEGLVKIYSAGERKVMALEGLDLKVEEGEMMAVIGKSGSGKSTLLNIIGGLESPTAGSFCFLGRNLSSLKQGELEAYRRHTVGFVWQKSVRNLFYYMTALENVEVPMCFERCPKAKRRKRAKELLALVGMERYANRYPRELSGGEQQRVAIAVSLANEPKLLLADEPTGAVDTRTAETIMELFRGLNQKLGLTILIVTHDMSLARQVDRIVQIADGKVTTEQLRRSRAGFTDGGHEEYVVMDRAHRLQLRPELLAAAGIESSRVKVSVSGQKIIISHGETDGVQ
ncbi:MAG: ABC transporter ATP-binding protein [Muribaculaceae bacterium]|nr:ABC transporter ATP-binding protein [Muribaculaceae bacterium]